MCLIPTYKQWIVLVQGQYIDEVARAPEEVLSFEIAVEEVRFYSCFWFKKCRYRPTLLQLLQTRYTMGLNLTSGDYHAQAIQNQVCPCHPSLLNQSESNKLANEQLHR